MTRRLIAASVLTSVLGGIAVSLAPAAAATDTGNYLCVYLDKGKDPHGTNGVCVAVPKLIGP